MKRRLAATSLTDALCALTAADAAAVVGVTDLLRGDPAIRDEIERRLGWRRSACRGSPYRTLMMLEWDDAPPPGVRAALDVWTRLPSLVADVVARHGWPSRRFDPPNEARLWILTLHCGRDRAAQQSIIDCAGDHLRTGDVDERAYAVAMDQVTAIDHDEQLYGTMVDDRVEPPFLLPVRDLGGLDRRRRSIGLPPVADDLAAGASANAIAARLARTARLP